MKWSIIADSSCDLTKLDNLSPDVNYAIVPLTIRVGEREFVDDQTLDIDEMMNALKSHKGATSSACPSVGCWAEQFMQAEQSIAITITSALSGSYNSARVAREVVLKEHPDKKIYILDSLSAGAELALIAKKAQQLICDRLDFVSVVNAIKEYAASTHLLFALSSFDNLIKNGRMPFLVGFVARKLNLRAIGIASNEGKLEMLHKARGETKMLSFILEEMERIGFRGGPVVIGHCENDEGATKLREQISSIWKEAMVSLLPTRGICSYYAEKDGLMIGF